MKSCTYPCCKGGLSPNLLESCQEVGRESLLRHMCQGGYKKTDDIEIPLNKKKLSKRCYVCIMKPKGENLQKGNEGEHGKTTEPPQPHILDQSEEHKEEYNKYNVHHGVSGKEE